MAEQKESFIEKVLRSVLISSKGGVPLQKLNYEFKELLGQDIPYKDNGFPNMEAYLKSMPRVVQIKRDASGQVVCMGVANEETQHLDRLVKKQKASKKKSKPARVPKFSGRPNNRPRRPPPHFPPQRRAAPSQPPKRAGGPPSQPSHRPQTSSQDVRRTHDAASKQRPPAANPPPLRKERDPPPQRGDRNSRPAPSRHKRVQPQSQSKGDYSSSYEVPPRFRRQINSTGSTSDEHSWDDSHETPPPAGRSHSAGDYHSAVIESSGEWGAEWDNTQPPQPPPVDEKVVSWVNEVLADKMGGLWMSGLKKLYREKFKETMDNDLVTRLERLSLWTAEEIGLVGNDKILYPQLQVEVSHRPSSGTHRRKVTNQQPDRTPSPTVPALVLPEDELWEVYVSYVISVVDFYCIIIGEDYSDKLCSLEDEMREFYESDSANLRLLEKPALDGLYAARLSDDWLRVRIIALEDDQAACFLVDHGDLETVPFDDIRALRHSYFNLAFQAVPCRLHGLEGKAGSETAVTRFCNIALAQTRLAEVMSRETPISLTLYRDSLNINYLCAMRELM